MAARSPAGSSPVVSSLVCFEGEVFEIVLGVAVVAVFVLGVVVVLALVLDLDRFFDEEEHFEKKEERKEWTISLRALSLVRSTGPLISSSLSSFGSSLPPDEGEEGLRWRGRRWGEGRR